jgi:hypothetical protein
VTKGNAAKLLWMNVIALAFTAGLAACTSSGAQDSGLTRLAGATVPYASNSGVATAEQTVIRTSNAWQDLWRRIHSIRRPAPALPAINFDREMVIFVAMGQQTSGQHAIVITGTEFEGQRFVVRVTQSRPGPGCIVTLGLTAPVDLAIVPRDDSQPEFEVRQVQSDC